MDEMDWEQGSPRRPPQQCPAMRPYGSRPPSQYYDPVHHASVGWYSHHRTTSASDPSSWTPPPTMNNNPFAYQLGPSPGPRPGYPMNMNMNMNMPYSHFPPPPMDNMHRHAAMQQPHAAPHHLPNPANTTVPNMYSEGSFSGITATPRGMHYPYQASAASPVESSSLGTQEPQTRAPNSSHTIQFGTAPTFSSQRPSTTFVPLRSRVPQASQSDTRSSIDSGLPAVQSERQPEPRRRAPGSRRSRGFMSSRLYPPVADGIVPGDGLPAHYLERDDDVEDLRVTQLLRGSIRTKQVVSSAAIRSLQSVPLSELEAHEMTCVICYNDYGVETPEGLKEAPLRLPKCKHVFGDHCIKKWFEDSDSCPYCRDKLQSEPRITAGPHQEYFREMVRAQGRIPRGVPAMTPSAVARAIVAQQTPSTERSHTHPQIHGLGQERRSPPTDGEESHRRQRPRHTSWGSGLAMQQQHQHQHQQQQNSAGRSGGMSNPPHDASTAEGQWLAGSQMHRAVTPPVIPNLPGGRAWTHQPVEPNQAGGWTGVPFESSRMFYVDR